MKDNAIIKDGEKYFYQRKLEGPRRDDFFHATGEVEFQGRYEQTGYFNEAALQNAQRQHSHNLLYKTCENKAGFYCKNKKCNYPTCLKDKTNV